MKRLPLRQLALVFGPGVAIAGALGVMSLIRLFQPEPPLTLLLSVPRLENRTPYFDWNGSLKGDAHYPMRVGYSASLVAKGQGHSLTLYQSQGASPASTAIPSAPWYDGKAQLGNSVDFSWGECPLWTRKLEWQVEVIAIPCDPTPTVSVYPLSATRIRQWASYPNALRISKQMSLEVTPETINPVLDCAVDSPQSPPEQEASNMRPRVCISVSNPNYRMFRCLEASDGKTRRILWQGKSSPCLISEQHVVEQINASMKGFIHTYDTSFLTFDLNAVPESWGKIIFRMEAAFDPVSSPRQYKPGSNAPPQSLASRTSANPPTQNQFCDEAQIQRLKARGWYDCTRQLTLRDTPKTK